MMTRSDRMEMQTIAERDHMETAFADAYALVMGVPMEWSSAYGTSEALRDMGRKLDREKSKQIEIHYNSMETSE